MFGLESTHKSQISAPLAPSTFSSFVNERKPTPKSPQYKNNLFRIQSLQGNGKKISTHFREEESFCENIQNLCTKKKCIFCYTYTPHIYILHTRTRTHPWDLTHLKSMKAAAIGQSEDLARPTDVLNPSAVVKSMPESLEFYWKCFCPAEVLFRTVTL